MRFFFREFKYYSIDMLHSFDGLFWTVLYPILLSSLFFIIFTAQEAGDTMHIEVGIEAHNPLVSTLSFVDLFQLHYIEEKDADMLLQNNTIKVFIQQDGALRIHTNGLSQTIAKAALDQIKQTAILGIPQSPYTNSFIDSRNEKHNLILILFYALLAMVSIYTMFGTLSVTEKLQANISKLAARISVTPIRRFQSYLAGMCFHLVFNYAANLLYIGFVMGVLKIPFITDMPVTLVLLLCANLFGTAFGLYIGSIPGISTSAKSTLCISVSIFLSFLSGMMQPAVKVALESAIPVLGIVNPLALLTTNLYNINILHEYGMLSAFFTVFAGFSAVLIGVAFLHSRKVCYDSL